MAQKIAIIGGGSAYAPGIINALIQNATVFSGMEIALMDIAPKELAIVQQLGSKLAQYSHVDLNITATTNQTEAIADSDFVLSTFRQGGFEARHLDETIPLKFDIIGQETIGPGGFFFAMRTLPVIKSIVEDMSAYAPKAVLINYSNPAQIVAEAVTHFSQVPCISICDQTLADKQNILHALGIPDADVFLESVGLNHATWSTQFLINGEDGIGVMNRHLKDVLGREDIDNRVKRQFRLANAYGILPNSYLTYYYFREETIAEAKTKPKTRAQTIIESLPGYYQHFKDQINSKNPQLTHVRGGAIFGDMAVKVIAGLVKKDRSIHTLNIPNQCALPDFPPDRIVEVPARLGFVGGTPLVQGHLPSEIVGLLHMLAEYQWLTAKSIWMGDRQDLEKALASNPLVLSLSMARDLLDAAYPLIKPYLPTNTEAYWL